MVTRIITRRIISSKERAAAEEDSNRDDVNRLKDNKQSDDDDDKKHGSNEETSGEETQKLCSFKTCQIKAADGGICDVPSSYHDVFFNDDTTDDDGKAVAVDIQRDSSTTTTRKRPLITDDADDTEQTGPNQLLDWTTHDFHRKRKKFIDLSDVPPQLPIKSSRKNGSSKYQGVSFDFDKGWNKWRARIKIDGKKHHIGSYDSEEKAAIDYARAKFKYKEDHDLPLAER